MTFGTTLVIRNFIVTTQIFCNYLVFNATFFGFHSHYHSLRIIKYFLIKVLFMICNK